MYSKDESFGFSHRIMMFMQSNYDNVVKSCNQCRNDDNSGAYWVILTHQALIQSQRF